VAALLTTFRRLPFRIRTGGLIAVLDVVSCVLFFELGPIPAAMLWLFAGVALAQLLLQRRGLILAGIAALCLLTIFGVLNVYGVLSWDVDPAVWFVQVANFAAVAAGIALATGFLVRRIESSLEREHSLLRVLASRHKEVRTAHEALQSEHARQEHLVHELHHRVRNNLQTLSSLLELECETVPERSEAEVLATFRGRLRSITAAHEALSASESMDRVQAETLIRAVVDETLCAAALRSAYPAVAVQGDQGLFVSSGEAVPMALICHEWLHAVLQRCSETTGIAGTGNTGPLKVKIGYFATPRREVLMAITAPSPLTSVIEEEITTGKRAVTPHLADQVKANTRIQRVGNHVHCSLLLASPAP
jgi:hypothetical protein